ncbi:MAG: motility associated factor glycosyltransferase family protein [Desulfovibrio sp.]|uniref:motility associated factor glycosyltransferase family protein n=1 Tax=Desulfovibrio sp. 7SRBS1 TaxID=3378064 RepID=UPI003B4033FF
MTQEAQESTAKLYHFLQDNLAALKDSSPALFQWLSKQSYDQERMEKAIFLNQGGYLDIRTPQGSGLYEPIPPGLFYKNWTYGDRVESSATFIIGSSLGYGINHVLTETPPTHKVFVLEPNPEVLLACLGQTDYSQFLSERRLFFIPPEENVMMDHIRELDVQFIFGRIELKEDLPSRQLGPEYAQWSKRAKARLDSFSIELTTLRSRQDMMVGNELKNFQKALSDGSLKAMQNCAKGGAAVIFGAGPSLSEFASEFRGDGGHEGALYVTSLQALPALQRNGVKPHFCMAIDYSEGMLQIYDTLDTEWARDIPLIYSTKIQPKVLEMYPGPTIPLWTMGGISSFVMEKMELVLDAGGNVGVTMMRFLRYCGVDDFLLVGQDFACLNNKTHAAGHHAANVSQEDIDRAYSTSIKNKDGETIKTSLQLLSAKRDLEDDLAQSSTHVYNLYGGGADIIGTTILTREEAMDLPFIRDPKNTAHLFCEGLKIAHQPRVWPEFEARANQWASSLRSVEKRLDKLFKKPEKKQKEIHEILQQIQFFLRQDPLYVPYLYNEIMDSSALVKARLRYVRKDLPHIKGMLRRALSKVREIDRSLQTQAA